MTRKKNWIQSLSYIVFPLSSSLLLVSSNTLLRSLFANTQKNKHGSFANGLEIRGRLILMYLLTAAGLTPGGSSTVHIYTQTIHRTTQLTTLVGRFSGIRTQSGQTKINDELIDELTA